MFQPNITVVKRTQIIENRPEGFEFHCLKYSDGTYSIRPTEAEKYKEDVIIYQGPCPANMRILPRVEPKYLRGYFDVYSQYVPKIINNDPILIHVARAVRSVFGSIFGYIVGDRQNIFDDCTYDNSGKIICIVYKHDKDGIGDYITSLLTKEDFDRIEKYENSSEEERTKMTYVIKNEPIQQEQTKSIENDNKNTMKIMDMILNTTRISI